ncbi:MAG TPA: type IV pilus modification protein PilV [Noviherbaspirillum sp.]|jgi:type IV pilus assembly protein PilV|uniref:type IV pilus modification protein PilV n=1 Tax=Noviherbaspirillum sp. TaxID=1926288 RepID=UPI002F931812
MQQPERRLNPASSQGISLVEVLVSLLILAAGIVTVAGLQAQALRSAYEAGLQSTALQIAGELAERMRPQQVRRGNSAVTDAFDGYSHDARIASPAQPGHQCDTDMCNPEQLAQFDLYQTAVRLHEDLPGGRIRICRDTRPWDTDTERLRWECDPGAAGEGPLFIKIGWQPRERRGAAQQPDAPPALALLVDR